MESKYDEATVDTLIAAVDVILNEDSPTIQAWINLRETMDQLRVLGGDA